MKKSLLALASIGAFAGAAQAQSSVTVYGIVDAGFASVSNTTAGGGSTTGVQSGGIASPRLGFRGVEDTGGGNKVGFVLEAEFNTANGTATSMGSNSTGAYASSQFFNRASFVSLSNAQYGDVKIGLSNTATYDAQVKFDPLKAANLGGYLNTSTMTATAVTGPVTTATSTTTTYSQQNGGNRANNAISYTSPTFMGVQARFITGESQSSSTTINNVAGNVAYVRVTDYGLSYNWQALDLAATYRTVGGSLTGQPATGTANSSFTATTGVYGSYNFGIIKPYLIYNTTSSKNINVDDGYSVISKMIGAEAPITPVITIAAQYTQNVNGNVGTSSLSGNSTAQGVMAKYALSKRSTLYAIGAFSQNGGAGANVASTSKFTGSNVPVKLTGQTAYANQTAYMLGLNHTF